MNQYLNGSIQNAIAVLRALQRSKRSLYTTDIANAARITRDQAFRALVTLCHEGLVNRVGFGQHTMWCLSDGVTIPVRRKHAETVA